MPARTTRSEKLDLRLTREAKRALQAAAAVSRRSVSEFVLESALARDHLDWETERDRAARARRGIEVSLVGHGTRAIEAVIERKGGQRG